VYYFVDVDEYLTHLKVVQKKALHLYALLMVH